MKAACNEFVRRQVHAEQNRNRLIGEFFKELDLNEGRSTGIPKILKVMVANGSPAPLFETDDERASFVVRLPQVIQGACPDQPYRRQWGSEMQSIFAMRPKR